MSNTQLQDLLVRREILTPAQLRGALAASADTQISWLEYLLLAGQIDENTVARCAVVDGGAPACDLELLAQVPKSVLAQLPRDLAIEHRMVPLWIDSDGDLSIGMVDPFDRPGVQEVEFFLGRRLLREVAPATPLAWALTTYYGAQCAMWPRPGALARTQQRLARGSTQPPLEDDLAYEVEISYDAADRDAVAVVGRAVHSSAVLLEVANR